MYDVDDKCDSRQRPRCHSPLIDIDVYVCVFVCVHEKCSVIAAGNNEFLNVDFSRMK